MNRKWLLMGVLGLGLAGWTTTPVSAADDKKDDKKAADSKSDSKSGDGAKAVRTELDAKNLPKEVRDKYDNKDQKITKAVKIERGSSSTMYRVTVEDDKRTRNVWLSSAGKVLDSEVIRENTSEAGGGERDNDRTAKGNDKDRTSGGNGGSSSANRDSRKELDVDNLPGGVKGALGKAYSLNNVEQVWQHTDGSNTYYTALVEKGGELQRIRISTDGDIKEISGNRD